MIILDTENKCWHVEKYKLLELHEWAASIIKIFSFRSRHSMHCIEFMFSCHEETFLKSWTCTNRIAVLDTKVANYGVFLQVPLQIGRWVQPTGHADKLYSSATVPDVNQCSDLEEPTARLCRLVQINTPFLPDLKVCTAILTTRHFDRWSVRRS